MEIIIPLFSPSHVYIKQKLKLLLLICTAKEKKQKKEKLRYTANIFEVFFTVFNCVPISTVISLYGLHFFAAPSTV